MVPEVDGSVKVYEVMPNSAALRAGLKEGDILMKLDDIQIDGDESLRELIVSLRPGSQVELSIKREDKPMKINLRVMGKLPARQ
jgi:S1-C subfamily serine protease